MFKMIKYRCVLDGVDIQYVWVGFACFLDENIKVALMSFMG